MISKDNIYGHIMVKNYLLGQYSYVFRGSLQWNKLPEFLRKPEKIGVFKKNLRKWVESNVVRFDG